MIYKHDLTALNLFCPYELIFAVCSVILRLFDLARLVTCTLCSIL